MAFGSVRRRAGRPIAGLLGSGLIYLPIGIGLLITAFPFYVSLTTSLWPESVNSSWPPVLWSWDLTLDNFKNGWIVAGFRRYALNTAIYATITATATTLLSAATGYAFARLRFRGRDRLFFFVLALMMVPGLVSLVPTFYLAVHFPLVGDNDLLGRGGHGLYDSWGGLLFTAFGSPGSIFLLRQFFKTLPVELEDAARIDGCSEPGIMWRIMMPLSMPGLATIFLFQFTGGWNTLIWPMTIVRNPDLYTIQVGLAAMAPRAGELLLPIGWAQAAVVMATVPLLILFLALQRYFVRGIALTGFK